MNLKTILILSAVPGYVSGYRGRRGQRYKQSLDEFEDEQGVANLGEDDEERTAREGRLKEREEEINKNNEEWEAGNAKYRTKLYDFSDWSTEEFETAKTGMSKGEAASRSGGLFYPADRANPKVVAMEARAHAKIASLKMDREDAPDSYDSTEEGHVTEVKNQGSCGSCVAFAANGMHETSMLLAGASMTNLDLSEQYLVDCAYGESGANGCDGASPQVYTDWLVEDGGLTPHEDDYPYLETEPLLNCDLAETVDKYDSGYKISDYSYTYSCDEDTMKTLVYEYGSVLTGIYASDSAFSNYAEGVFDGCSSDDENHAVLVVGYGTSDEGDDYWLVKNSWSTYWGDSGFVKIKRGDSMCGIGNICVWSETEATGTATDDSTDDTSDEDDETEDTEDEEEDTTDETSSCDLSGYGANLNGEYQLRVWNGRTRYVSQVSCVDDICTPLDTAITDACNYICGSDTCPP